MDGWMDCTTLKLRKLGSINNLKFGVLTHLLFVRYYACKMDEDEFPACDMLLTLNCWPSYNKPVRHISSKRYKCDMSLIFELLHDRNNRFHEHVTVCGLI